MAIFKMAAVSHVGFRVVTDQPKSVTDGLNFALKFRLDRIYRNGKKGNGKKSNERAWLFSVLILHKDSKQNDFLLF